MDSKQCNECKNDRFINLFGKDVRNTDWLKGVCKLCENERLKEWRKNNKEGKYAVIQEKDKLRANQYYYANKDECDRKNKEWQLANPEKKKEIDKKYYWENRDKSRLIAKVWSGCIPREDRIRPIFFLE